MPKIRNVAGGEYLLSGPYARELYHGYAEHLPILDYHCHLEPQKIAEDYRFHNLGELMLGGDHYKWRAMRAFGIDESLITGDAPYRDKFRAYAAMLPYAIGNPLYAWTHLELRKYFGIREALTEESADRIFDAASEKLSGEGFSARGLIRRSDVRVICTTDDPFAPLEWHRKIREDGFETDVLPTFRPDRLLGIEKPDFGAYIAAAGIHSYDELKQKTAERLDYFVKMGCRVTDHGLSPLPYARGNASAVFEKRMQGTVPDAKECEIFRTELLLFLAREYAGRGLVMQLHFGPMRNNNSRMFNAVGPDTGFDSIGDDSSMAKLCQFFDALEKDNLLPKTILYSLNGEDNRKLAALMGSFQRGPVRSRIQLGSGWWFNDTRSGMEEQMKALAELGILGNFIGMLTDSRSFISYPRHEYFRRILCNLVGEYVEKGEYPADFEALGKIITGICYTNARDYFGFEESRTVSSV